MFLIQILARPAANQPNWSSNQVSKQNFFRVKISLFRLGDPIPIESVFIFESFLKLHQSNSLVLYSVICNEKQLKYLNKNYWPRLEIDCLPKSIETNPITNDLVANFLDDNNETTDHFLARLLVEPINKTELFQKLNDYIIISKPSQFELLNFVEKIPKLFYKNQILDVNFNQSKIDTKVRTFNSVATFQLDTDVIHLNEQEFRKPNHRQNYIVVKTIIKKDEFNANLKDKHVNDSLTNLVLNSNVVTYNIFAMGKPETIHNASIRISFRNIQRKKHLDLVYCVYWDSVKKAWSSTGCQIDEVNSNITETICQCDHLTSFAVLLDITGREASQKDTIKRNLTYVCCGCSSIGLIISIWLMCYVDKNRYHFYDDRFRWRMNRWIIMLNTAICLLITNLLALFGLERRDNEVIKGFYFKFRINFLLYTGNLHGHINNIAVLSIIIILFYANARLSSL